MNTVLFVLIASGLVAVNLLRGGVRTAFALPAYGLLALAACLSLICLRRVALGWSSRICLVVSTLCFGYILLRTEFSPYEYLARYNLYLVCGALIAYLLTALYVTDSRLRVTFVAVLLVLGVANCAVGAIQFFESRNFMPFPLLPRSDGYGARASGFFLVPNSLAGFLEICLLMGLSMVWWGRWSVYAKILAGYAAGVCLAGIVVTGSRGGYLSTMFGLLIFVCLSALAGAQRLRDRAWMVFLAAACVALVVGWGVKKSLDENYMLQARASSMFLEKGDTRVALWKAAMKQFSLAPVLGTGSSTYLYYGRQFRTPIVQTDPMLVHNEYLQLLAEYGIVGLVGIGLFLLEHLRSGKAALVKAISRHSRIVDTHSNTLALTIGSLSCVGAYAVHAALDFNFHVPANALPMAVIFGFLAVPGRESQVVASGGGRFFDRTYGVLLAGLGVCLAVVAAQKFPAEYMNEKTKLLDANWVSVETDRAIENDVRRGLAFDRENPELQSRLAKSLLGQARECEEPAERERLFRESLAASQRALELAPQDVTLVLAHAQGLDTVARYPEAETLYQRALELDPNSGWVHWAFAVHYHLQSLLDQAEAEYKRSADLGYRPGALGLERLRQQRQATTQP